MLLAGALAWTLFAFAGYYAWTQWPALVAVLLAAAIVRPRVASAAWRVLDLSLLACLACALAQTARLPRGWRDAVSPHMRAVDEIVLFNPDAHQSVSLNPEATLRAAVVMVLVLLMFWTCREAFARGGTRRIARTVAWSGFAVAVVAIVSKAISPELLYATWSPGPSASPYGPFINRNHMGSWLVMGTPLVLGYMATRLQKRGGRRGLATLDATTLWLGGAAAAMYAASILSLSRSTFLGMVAALLCAGFIAVVHRGRGAAAWLMGIVVVSAFIAAAMPRTADLLSRFEHSGIEAKWSRIQIWHDTLPMVRDFPLTGVGLGAYRNAMVVYQQADRELSFNQAHNHYLQLVAEGGLFLAIPLVLAGVAFASTVLRRMKEDRSPTFWMRAGATAGIIGIGTQSLWETGLRMPANALLFAAICAVAAYDPYPDRGVETLAPPDRRTFGTTKKGWDNPSPQRFRS